MSQPSVNFIHLCDAATIDGAGKLNLLGIFSKIYLEDVPSKLYKFTAVLSIGFEKRTDLKNTLEIKIFGFGDEEVSVQPFVKVEFVVPHDGSGKKPELNLILDITNLEFKNFGKHVLRVYLNDNEIGSKEFMVEKRGVK